MKKTMVVATFLALGAGAVGLSAPNGLALKGSDTLFALTQAVIAACPNATGTTYAGTGSGAGENAMLAGTQTVAPMSRFLGANACAATGATPTQSEGIAVAADGISIVAAQSHQVACDPLNTDANCNHTGGAATGLARNTVLTDASLPGGTYTLADWKEVLRLIYFGMRNFSGTASVVNTIAQRNCADPVRFYLTENYGKLFQNECGGNTGGCTKLKHAFRRDQNSGTTDSFRVLVGFQDLNGTTGAPFCNQWIPNTAAAGPATAGGDHYYNSYDKAVTPPFTRPAARGQNALLFGVNKGCNTSPSDTCGSPGLVCSGASPDATHTGTCQPKACVSASDCGSTTGIGALSCVAGFCEPTNVPGAGVLPSQWLDIYQDSDPIRRTCDGLNDGTGAAEQVCSWRGDLGLVLPVSIPTTAAAVTYASAPCDPATPFRNGAGIRLFGPDTNGDSVCALCPNGALPAGTQWNATIQAAVGPSTCQCLVPVTAGNDARCLNSKGNIPTQSSGNFPPLDGAGVDQAMRTSGTNPKFPAAIRDGRVYNLHLRTNASGGYANQTYSVGTTAAARPILGAFYRIHSTRTLLASGTCTDAGGACCQDPDATRQIGCLVQASPCSIGFAGREASENVNLHATEGSQSGFGLALNQVTPDASCILGGTYPLSRILYFNSTKGFETLATSGDQELELARCYSGKGTGASTLNTVAAQNALVAANGFIGINPFCKDFQEELSSVCATPIPPGVNACANNGALGIAP
ncbi:MAG TPA: hypothetical protein VG937_23000 [Polyangiaceae bacterium]|nr:hypothetical protein [Polyangiaceae bacterium]